MAVPEKLYELALLKYLTPLTTLTPEIWRLVEQYTITVVRGIEVQVQGGRLQVAKTIILPDSVMKDVYKKRMVMDRVVEAMQVLVQTQFPTTLGFQGLNSLVDDNLNEQFLAGEEIYQVFHGNGHFVLCFAESSNLYYICSQNKKKPSAVVKDRMARMFCTDGGPAIEVRVVRVEQQKAAECGCRATTLMALLSSGVGINEARRVKYPSIKTQYADLEHCLVEGQWLPRWAENLQYHDEPYKAAKAKTFKIKWPRKGRSILPLSLSYNVCIHVHTRVIDRATHLHVMIFPI